MGGSYATLKRLSLTLYITFMSSQDVFSTSTRRKKKLTFGGQHEYTKSAENEEKLHFGSEKKNYDF